MYVIHTRSRQMSSVITTTPVVIERRPEHDRLVGILIELMVASVRIALWDMSISGLNTNVLKAAIWFFQSFNFR